MATTQAEVWPAWAKVLLVGFFVLALIVVLPWIFMWSTMAASCIPMMNGMPGMMGPGMMR